MTAYYVDVGYKPEYNITIKSNKDLIIERLIDIKMTEYGELNFSDADAFVNNLLEDYFNMLTEDQLLAITND